MFNVKMTKNGSLAVILPNTDESKRVILTLLSGALMLPQVPEPTALPDAKPTLSDAEKFMAAKSAKLPKVSKKSSVVDYVYENLTAEQRMLEDLRYSINAAIIEFAQLTKRVVNEDTLGGYYTIFYAKLRAKTGYVASRKTILAYYNPHRATKINTVLKDGMGPEMLRVINQEVRALSTPRKLPRLVLNPAN
ncbi:hypothetical protein [Paenibacillus sp. UASWS1643]|uniref:hypothetical protein n=1 Tax=Paenibacillus sp. UASWS1643 TaxID=2580422 RepID=UPI00123C5725|nr:hypothetical protein [Paenibacillus sp. UASWS1643]KAA8750200.1 hypothetical protein FE296_16545 [Paenibacillus sp. UASWS1643]